MKKTILSILAGLVAVTAANAQQATTATTTSAQGLLGTNYYSVGGTYNHSDVQAGKIDIWGANIGINYHTYQDGDFGLDLRLAAGAAVDGKKHITVQQQSVGLSARPYYSLAPELKVFGAAGIGYNHSRVAVPGARQKDDQFIWGLGLGLEYVIDEITLTAGASYDRATDGGNNGVWAYGASANYWIDAQWGVGAGYSYLDYKHGHGNEVSATVRYRF